MAGWKLDKLPTLPGSGVGRGQPALGPENIGAHLAALQAKHAAGLGSAGARHAAAQAMPARELEGAGTRRAALKRPAEAVHSGPAEVRPNLEDARIHQEQQQQRFEAKLAQGDAADVVQHWCDYAEWTAKNLPSKHASIVKRACHSLVAAKGHHDDVRHLRLWVQYGCTQEEPHKVFGMLFEHGVGVGHSLLYEAWAACCEKRHCFFAADEAYRRGIERGAHPLAKLKSRHAEFEQRMRKRDVRRTAAGVEAGVSACASESSKAPLARAPLAPTSWSMPPLPSFAPPSRPLERPCPPPEPALSSKLDQLWQMEEERGGVGRVRGQPPSEQEPAAPAASGTKRARAQLEDQQQQQLRVHWPEEGSRSSAVPVTQDHGRTGSEAEAAEQDQGGDGKRRRLAAWVPTPFSRFWAARPAPADDKAAPVADPAPEEEEEEEAPPTIELTEEEKKMWFRPIEDGIGGLTDIASQVLNHTFTAYSIPDKAEGFDDVRYEWQAEAKAQEYLKAWVARKKIETRIESLMPGEWFNEQQSAFVKSLQEWQATSPKPAPPAPKPAAEEGAKEGAKEGEEGEETKAEPAVPKEEADLMTIEDICDTGGGAPLFAGFAFEDWALLTLRHEFQLLAAAFMKDCGDPERVGVHESHIFFYYSKYFKKQLNPKAYGKDTLPELISLIEDTVGIDGATKVLVSKLEGGASSSLLVKLAERARRERTRRLDAGDETVRLNFSLLKQILLAPPPPMRQPMPPSVGGTPFQQASKGGGGGKGGQMGGKGKFQQPKGGYGKRW
mmetsp:Transcript_36511/g.96625  ORF Transcript_36511/g.96625 Transcript_36511/m.96625 type:complete len:782 (-) Transcript_36511:128-2473(-)